MSTVGAQSPDAGFAEQLSRDVRAYTQWLGCAGTLDVHFVCFLRRLARFGYVTVGPITLDVRLLEDLVERTAVPVPSTGMTEDMVPFSRLLMEEVRRSGRMRIDELHYLLAFMRCNAGLPGRVFGELGVTPEQLERHLKRSGGTAAEPAERLMSPEAVADYLGVHVQTVRTWIRSGKLPARRLAGLRTIRIRSSDVETLLQPLDEHTGDVDDQARPHRREG
jgi:excisionase family DNA binding protein